jgi:hypothetical protein
MVLTKRSAIAFASGLGFGRLGPDWSAGRLPGGARTALVLRDPRNPDWWVGCGCERCEFEDSCCGAKDERGTREIAEQAALRIGREVETGPTALYDHDIVEMHSQLVAFSREPEVAEQIVEAREVSRGRARAEPVGEH